jgi:L-iditol 2-dehydrogenase
MLQANLKAIREFHMETVEIPQPKENEVLIKVVQGGICGSDLHAYDGKHPFISFPIVPGHEFVGVVVNAGDGSTELLDKRVTALPSLVCGSCYNCRTGRFNICESLRVIGCQAPGAFAEYVVVPKDRVFVLPNEFSWDQGLLVEPLAVAVHAVRRVPNIAGQSVLVLGAGTIGLMTVATLKAYGAGTIVVTDFQENRLRLAKELGANHVINPEEVELGSWLAENLERVDTTFECVGIGETVNQGIVFTHKGGNVVIQGVFEEDVMVNMGLVQDKELNVIGTLMYTSEDYVEAMRIISQTPEITKLVTHRFPLIDVAEAFSVAKNSPSEAIKVVVEVIS